MWKLWDYRNSTGENKIKEWTQTLQKIQIKKLNSKLDMLQNAGGDLPPQLLAGTGVPHIYKLKVQGNPKLRPLLCKGTIDNEGEYTLLMGAKEIQFEYEPADALMIATERREELLNDPTRRCKHERVAK